MRSPLAAISTVFLVFASASALAQSDRLAKTLGLSRAEKEELNVSLPSAVRDFLETSDRFDIFAQLIVRDGRLQPAMDRELVPNFKATGITAETRRNILKALYAEASKGEPPAVCYLPSHAIVARNGDREVTVEICFGCNRFYISGALGESRGTFSRDSGETERLITELIANSGVTTK